MSASATNVVRDTTAVDYLNWLRLFAQSTQNANTAGTRFTPLYIPQTSDILDITDVLNINGTLESLADIIDITDSVTNSTQNSGTYVIDTAKIDFADMG